MGISAKNRNDVVKNSRLSDKIDFAREWFNFKCTEAYFNQVRPLFNELREKKGTPFSAIVNKHNNLYLPILLAFKEEVEIQQRIHGQEVAQRLLQYLIGQYDFYQFVKEDRCVRITSFNINGTLPWGDKVGLANNIVKLDFKRGSKTTLEMILNGGWSLSFRIHNASSMCEPSLKFDVRIVGWPSRMTVHSVGRGDSF